MSHNIDYRTCVKGRRTMSVPYLGGGRFLGCFELCYYDVISLLVVWTSILKVARKGLALNIVYSTLSPCVACDNFKKVLEVA